MRESQSRYRLVEVTIAGYEGETAECYVDDSDRWNGWLRPMMTESQLEDYARGLNASLRADDPEIDGFLISSNSRPVRLSFSHREAQESATVMDADGSTPDDKGALYDVSDALCWVYGPDFCRHGYEITGREETCPECNP